MILKAQHVARLAAAHVAASGARDDRRQQRPGASNSVRIRPGLPGSPRARGPTASSSPVAAWLETPAVRLSLDPAPTIFQAPSSLSSATPSLFLVLDSSSRSLATTLLPSQWDSGGSRPWSLAQWTDLAPSLSLPLPADAEGPLASAAVRSSIPETKPWRWRSVTVSLSPLHHCRPKRQPATTPPDSLSLSLHVLACSGSLRCHLIRPAASSRAAIIPSLLVLLFTHRWLAQSLARPFDSSSNKLAKQLRRHRVQAS